MSLTEIQPIVEPRSIEPQSVVVEPKTVPVEKKEIITAEEIIEQELLRANLKPESTIVRSQEGKSEMAKGAEVAQTAIQPTPQKEYSRFFCKREIACSLFNNDHHTCSVIMWRGCFIHLLSGFILFVIRQECS